jgi:hypothetical protein
MYSVGLITTVSVDSIRVVVVTSGVERGVFSFDRGVGVRSTGRSVGTDVIAEQAPINKALIINSNIQMGFFVSNSMEHSPKVL